MSPPETASTHEQNPASAGQNLAHVLPGSPTRCEGCGAQVEPMSDECAYCGTRIPDASGLEGESRSLLTTLEVRLEEAVTMRTDLVLIVIFFLCLAAGPASYAILASLTDFGWLARTALALPAAVFGFFVFGWQCGAREGQAEQIAWRDMIGPEIYRFLDRKGLAALEMMVLARRILDEKSRLRNVMEKWLVIPAATGSRD